MLINPRDKKCENMNSLIDLGLGLFDAKNKDSVLTVNAESPFVAIIIIRLITKAAVLLRKRCSEHIQQIYSRTPMPKCDFGMGVLL